MGYTKQLPTEGNEMDAPRLVARFRNVSTNIDTISEHKNVIYDKGTVYWGWWKKDIEEQNPDFFCDSPSLIYIINAAEKKLYIAHYTESFLSSDKQPDVNRIPEYYKSNRDKVAGWFLLSYIEEVPYDKQLEQVVGQKTLLRLETKVTEVEKRTEETVSPKEEKILSNKNSILHLSDIHFGKDHAFRTEESESGFGKKFFSETVINDLKSIGYDNDIEAILITGDVTTQGDWSDETNEFILKELHKISDSLGVKKNNILVCPGNHDIVRYQPDDNRNVNEINVELQTNQKHEKDFRYFLEELTDRNRDRKDPLDYFQAIELNHAQVVICVLNSCRVAAEGLWTEYGYVGPAGINVIEEAVGHIDDDSERKQYRIISLHHHLLPVNSVESLNKKGVSLTIDSVQILDAAIESNFDVAIHGHQHCSRVARYEKVNYEFEHKQYNPITVVAGGSSGVNKDRRLDSMSNSYSLITANQEKLTLSIREINNDGNLHRYLFKNVDLNRK